MIKLLLEGVPFATRITTNETTLKHSHDFYEFLIITEGSLTNVINDEEECLELGDILIIPPDVEHHFLKNQQCVHRDIMVCPDLFAESCAFLDISKSQMFFNSNYLKIRIPVEAIQLIEQMIVSYIATDSIALKTQKERAIVTQLITLSLFSNFTQTQSLDNFKTQCISLINEKFTSPNAIKIICDYFHYNQSYMCEKFKRVFGITMTNYLNDLRVARAAYLLSVSSYSLREICDFIGFNSLSYFNKIFKEHYSASPAKYRKQGGANARISPISRQI